MWDSRKNSYTSYAILGREEKMPFTEKNLYGRLCLCSKTFMG